MNLFDYAEGERLKKQGMSLAANQEGKPCLLDVARHYARIIAIQSYNNEVNADDVFRLMSQEGITEKLGAAAGSLFKGKEWEFTGKRVKSQRTSNHAREIKVWRYVGK
tara:strand:+ start:910 stop:1233 length:324 start_codon:yes stop_codon:yes gene_type:complete